jgi:16S rRNA (uracil1498-N3)-methyltransferase
MRRFFFTPDDRVGDKVTLCQKESHHIRKVLRLHPGEKIELFDGSETLYNAEIVELGKNVQLRIIFSKRIDLRQKSELWLGQGVVKTKKMELLLQKCTELGVNGFTPFISSRCQGNLVEQSRQKDERWRRIIHEACKQCFRPQPMTLFGLQSFEEVTAKISSDHDMLKLLFWEKEREISLVDFSADIKSCPAVKLLFGPEGGFTASEVEAARLAGWQTVGLGERILRAETAAMAAVAIVQHLLGNM